MEKMDPYATPNLTQRLQGYTQNPRMIYYDLQLFVRKFIYKINNVLDPMPPIKRNENARQYFDRIDPRFGMRFYWHLLHTIQHYDMTDALNYINEKYPRTKDRKPLIELVQAVNRIDQYNTESFQRYYLRNQFQKSKIDNEQAKFDGKSKYM